MDKKHGAERLIWEYTKDEHVSGVEWKRRFLIISTLFAHQNLSTWNGLTIDALRNALEDARLDDYVHLLTPIELTKEIEFTEEPDVFLEKIAPPPTRWQKFFDTLYSPFWRWT